MNERELRARRTAKLAEARRLMDEAHASGTALRGEAKLHFEEAVAEASGCADDLRALEARNELLATDAFGTTTRTYGSSRPTYWRDGSGAEVRSFRAGESIYEHQRDRRGWDPFWDEVSIGGYFRALAVGPATDAERRAMSSTGGVGANIPAPLQARVLDRLREATFLSAAGAQFVPMESATLTIVRGSTAATFSWLAEGSTGASTDPSFTSVQLSANTYRGIVRASRELIQDAVDLPDALERELIGGLVEVLQRAVISGTTAATQPTGLLNDSNVNSANFGSTGGSAPSSTGAGSWVSLLQAHQRLREDNVPDGNISVVWAPRTARQFQAIRTASDKLWLPPPPELQGVSYYTSNAMPINLAPTTGLSNQSSIVMGDFNDLVIGMRLEPNLQVLEERYAQNWQVGYLASMRVDAAPRRPQSFEVLNRVST